MKVWQKNLILIVLVVLLAALPLWLLPDAEFGGADGQAEEAILELQPDYEPWFEPILEPASGEVESLLFALQAAIGAGVVGFVLGRITKSRRRGSRADGNRPLRLSIAAAADLPMPKLLLTGSALVLCLLCDSVTVSLVTLLGMWGLVTALGGLSPRVFLRFLCIPMAFLAIGCVTILINSYPRARRCCWPCRWGAAVGL